MGLLLQKGLAKENHGRAGLNGQLSPPTLLALTPTMSAATFIKSPKLRISIPKAFTSTYCHTLCQLRNLLLHLLLILVPSYRLQNHASYSILLSLTTSI